MKYLKKYTNHLQYEQDTNYLEPNISYCQILDEVHYMPLIMTIYTNPEVLAICYALGWCQSPLYMTKAEAEKVDSTLLLNVINSNRNNITHFEEFKYFTKVTRLITRFCSLSKIKHIEIPNTVVSIADYVFYGALIEEFDTKNVERIADGSFLACNNLKKLNIGPALTGSIATSLCACSKSLEVITVDPENTYYRTNGTCLISNSNDMMILLCKNGIIPEGVKSLRSSSARELIFETLEIPSTVTSFGSYVFYHSTINNLILKSLNPPTLNNSSLSASTITNIYVPASSVEAYKTASGWSTYANRIQAIPE